MTVAPHFFEGAGLDRRVCDVDKMAATVIEMLNAPAIENQKLYDQKLGWLLDAEWDTTTPMDPIDRSEMFALLESVLTDSIGAPRRKSKQFDRMNDSISFVAVSEFDRLRRLNISEFERAALFADLCRLNTLSMIAYAGSGHIGSSFSSLDIVTWLFLNETARTAAANGEGDLYFSSKGHDAPGLYAAMIALRKAAGRRAAQAAPARRAARPSRCRHHARMIYQYRLARHGHLQGQGHGRSPTSLPAVTAASS